jgi:hypothetical protein
LNLVVEKQESGLPMNSKWFAVTSSGQGFVSRWLKFAVNFRKSGKIFHGFGKKQQKTG